MASVSNLVTKVSKITGVPEKTVAMYARELLNGGLLPKSRGRAIAEVEPVHIIRLFLALAIDPKMADAAEKVKEFGDLLDPDGVRAEDHLVDLCVEHVGKPAKGIDGQVVVDRSRRTLKTETVDPDDGLISRPFGTPSGFVNDPANVFSEAGSLSLRAFSLLPEEYGDG